MTRARPKPLPKLNANRFSGRAIDDRSIYLGWDETNPTRLHQLELMLGDASAYAEVYLIPRDPWGFVLSSNRYEQLATMGFDCEPGDRFAEERRLTLSMLTEITRR